MTEQEQQQQQIQATEFERTEATIAKTIGGVSTLLIEAIKRNAEKVGRTLSAMLILISTAAIPSNEATPTEPPQPVNQGEVQVYQAGVVPADRQEQFNGIVSSLMVAQDQPEVK